MTPEWRQRLTRSQRRMLKLAGRRLLASPWFAAGAGFVIATGAIIYSPHAQLFAPAIQVTHCKSASCTQKQPLIPQGIPPKPAGVGAPVPVPTIPPGTTFWYQSVGPSTRSGFGMWIEIHATHSLGPWHLRFAIPGATGLYVVYGAQWQSSSPDSGTASSYNAATESAGFAQISAHESGGESGFSRTGYTVIFQVRGTGTPGSPIDCYYNDAACTFRLSHDLALAAQPGPE